MDELPSFNRDMNAERLASLEGRVRRIEGELTGIVWAFIAVLVIIWWRT